MSITALDIQQQGFEHERKGYNVGQVDEFLERVAQGVDELTRQNEELTRALAAAQQAAQAAQAAQAMQAAAPEPQADPAELEQANARAKAAEVQAASANEQLKASADKLRVAEDKLRAANTKISSLEKKVSEHNDMDSVISNAFISAQQAADNLKEEARAEGERIYRESETKARDLIRETLEEKQRILDEIDGLAISCDNFRAQYRSLIEHFSAEADRKFSDVHPPVVTEEDIDAAMPEVENAAPAEGDEIHGALESDELIEEISLEDID